MKLPSPWVGLNRRADRALRDPQLSLALNRLSERFSKLRVSALDSLPDVEGLRDRARLIRAHTLSQLDFYLQQFAAAVEVAGGKVHFAASAETANKIVVELAQARQVKRIVKSKSMLSEEIELNQALEAAGLSVIESDLGEYIVQLAGERPSHIIGPAVHKTKEQIGELFHRRLGIPLSSDPAVLAAAARELLRDVFLTADMGISGVNFGVAESGTICLVTNEGNGRLSTSAPRIHVALMGIERLVPTLDDLSVMLQLLARSGTGQKLTVYTSLITGPRKRETGREEPDGPDELHVILIDSGRSRVLGTESAEILYCIRCAACLNVCPVYREIGGHAYGSVYPGPIGAALTPALAGIPQWSELPYASTLCGMCREVCPIRIDIPRILLQERCEATRVRCIPLWQRLGMPAFSFVATHPRLFHWGRKVLAAAIRLLAGQQEWLGWLPPPLGGWTEKRDFPVLVLHSLRERLKRRQNKRIVG